MKRTVTAALLLSLIASTAAVADSGKAAEKPRNSQDRRDERRDDRWDRRDERRDDRWDRRDERRDDRWDRRDERRDDRWDRRDERRDDRWDRRDERRDDRRDWRRHHGRVWYGDYHRPHGWRPHAWRRGERLPVAYYGRPYVIRDYDRCHLRRPPRGYHWVRVDRDVVLAAIATGVILDVLSDHFY